MCACVPVYVRFVAHTVRCMCGCVRGAGAYVQMNCKYVRGAPVRVCKSHKHTDMRARSREHISTARPLACHRPAVGGGKMGAFLKK